MSAREFPSEEEKQAYEDVLKEARCRIEAMIEAERKATIEKHEAAMQAMKAQMLALDQAHDLNVQNLLKWKRWRLRLSCKNSTGELLLAESTTRLPMMCSS
jgi:hypothetical protein